MAELKRCPFCGGEAGIIKYMDGTYCVECKNDNCNMIAMTVLADTEAKAVEIWNTRPNPWHTGTPTEEGWYLIKYRGIYGRAIGRTEYRAIHRYRLDGFLMIDGGIGADDIWKPIEWQKIEEGEELDG